jgi:arginyl-tRNA--protein-N-Asp/Glu arginylyltransferase
MIYSLYDPDLKEISAYKAHVKKSKRLEQRKYLYLGGASSGT